VLAYILEIDLNLLSLEQIIVAIDGHSSCGKSTLAKAMAAALQYAYVDSGAMYRAVTLYFIQNQIDITQSAVVDDALKHINISFKHSSRGNRTILNGEDVEDEIRKMYVSEMVSQVAAISVVRAAMVAQQQELGRHKGIVMDGRDIGTVVFPNAELKIFLTAEVQERARRRFEELKAKGQAVSLEEIAQNLKKRDHLDSTRSDSPLKKADDAVVIDNTHLSKDQQLQLALDLVQERVASL